MPRKRAKAILRRGTLGLPPDIDLEYILHGRCMLDGDGPSASDSDLWNQYGQTIMDLQAVECAGAVPWHSDPFFFDLWERPALWWRCGPGAEEGRLLVSGDPSQAMPEKGLEFGRPHVFRTMNHGLVYETERDYLIRRNLLTDQEREQLEVETNAKKEAGPEV
jgi:hypothetical protein